MVESRGKNHQITACKLKGIAIGNRHALGMKVVGYMRQKIGEGLPKVLLAVGRTIKGHVEEKKEG
jgi:hypothetical protein